MFPWLFTFILIDHFRGPINCDEERQRDILDTKHISMILIPENLVEFWTHQWFFFNTFEVSIVSFRIPKEKYVICKAPDDDILEFNKSKKSSQNLGSILPCYAIVAYPQNCFLFIKQYFLLLFHLHFSSDLTETSKDLAGFVGDYSVRQGSISSMFYVQLLQTQIPKTQKATWLDCLWCTVGICGRKSCS